MRLAWMVSKEAPCYKSDQFLANAISSACTHLDTAGDLHDAADALLGLLLSDALLVLAAVGGGPVEITG